MMVSQPKRFVKKTFNPNKNRNWQGSYSSKNVKEGNANGPQKDEDKKEKKLIGDSGYDCNYCQGKTTWKRSVCCEG